MKPTNTTSGISRLFLFLAGIMIMLLGARAPAAAQSQGQNYGYTSGYCWDAVGASCAVWGYSYFLAPNATNGSQSTTADEVWAYSETEVTMGGTEVGSEAQVTGCLYDISQPNACYSSSYCSSSPAANTCLVNGEWNFEPDPWYQAGVDTSYKTNLGDSYEIDSDNAFYECSNGCQQYNYGWLSFSIPTGAPVISSISPSQVTDGGSGIMTISGSNLCDVFGSQSYLIDTPGITLSDWNSNSNCSTWTANYSVDNAASSGVYTFTQQTAFGQSTGSFSVVRPTPVIASVSPSTWTPGSGTITVTIKGQFYGPYLVVFYAIPGMYNAQIPGSVTRGAHGEISLSITMEATSLGGTGIIAVISYNDAAFDGPLYSAPFSITVPGNPGSAPIINSVSPQQLTEGASSTVTLYGGNYPGTTGSFTISGSNLLSGNYNDNSFWIDQNGCYATESCYLGFISGASWTDKQITAGYAMSYFAAPGTYTIWVKTAAGEASIDINVVTPAPVITSVSPPSPWNVGSGSCKVPFQLFGNFYGPLIHTVITGPENTFIPGSLDITSYNNAEIDGSIELEPTATGGQVQFYAVSMDSIYEDVSDGRWSAPYNITVVPIPTPVITGIGGEPWDAGAQNLPFTINGTNFGGNPAVTITGTGISSYSITSTSNTAINGNITIDWAAPAGDATVQVAAAGCSESSSSIASSSSAKRSEATPMAAATGPVSGAFEQPIDPFAPVPQIVFATDTAACNTPGANVPPASVVIGQKMTLAGCVPGMPSGTDLGIISQSWKIDGDITAGYTYPPGYTSLQQGATEVPFSSANDNPVLFYWKAIPLGQGPAIQPTGGTNVVYNVAYTYTLNNLSTGSVSVPFTVHGPAPTGAANAASPNGTFFTAIPGTVNVWPANVGWGGNTAYPWLEFGNLAPNPGMTFNVTAAAPGGTLGTFQWVQLINSSTMQNLSNPATVAWTLGTGLDSYYPYPVITGRPNITYDSPGLELATFTKARPNQPIPMGEGADNFGATMYLMWDPTLNADGSACTAASTTQDPDEEQPNPPVASTCFGSIPVPLGYVVWGFNGDAINTLQLTPADGQACAGACGDNQTSWMLQPCSGPSPANPSVQSGNIPPQWNAVAKNQ